MCVALGCSRDSILASIFGMIFLQKQELALLMFAVWGIYLHVDFLTWAALICTLHHGGKRGRVCMWLDTGAKIHISMSRIYHQVCITIQLVWDFFVKSNFQYSLQSVKIFYNCPPTYGGLWEPAPFCHKKSLKLNLVG